MPGLSDPAPRTLATIGLAGATVAVVTVGALHVVATDVSPVTRTISQYAVGPAGWLFDLGVLALAGGAGLVLVALVRLGITRWRSLDATVYGLGVLGLILVVAFEKTNWSVGPSLSGVIHRYASLVAFLAIPAAALAMGLRHRRHWGRPARWTAGFGAATLAWLGVILAGIPIGLLIGRPWWQVLPLGITERGLALTLLATVVALACWARTVPIAIPAPVALASSAR